jgi:hypothetical protein
METQSFYQAHWLGQWRGTNDAPPQDTAPSRFKSETKELPEPNSRIRPDCGMPVVLSTLLQLSF